jgi:thiamine biosynthesis protein ThiS
MGMNITVNGESADIAEQVSISDLLTIRNVKMPDMVSVERNGEMVDRSAFGETFLAGGDKIEFLYFMGGGNGSERTTRCN